MLIRNKLVKYLYDVNKSSHLKLIRASDLLIEFKSNYNYTDDDFYEALQYLEERKYIVGEIASYRITGEGMDYVEREIINTLPNYPREAIQLQQISNNIQDKGINYSFYALVAAVVGTFITIILPYAPYLLNKPTTGVNPVIISEPTRQPTKVIFDNVEPNIWFAKSYQSIPDFTPEKIINDSGDDFEWESSYYRIYRHPSDCQSSGIRGVLIHVIFFTSDAGSREYFTKAFADIKNTDPIITNSVGETSYFRTYPQDDSHCGGETSDTYSLLFQRFNTIGIIKTWSVKNSIDKNSVQEWLNRIAIELDTTLKDNSK
jgi:hypothetical protein